LGWSTAGAPLVKFSLQVVNKNLILKKPLVAIKMRISVLKMLEIV
jgi:hypothetical protein